MVGLNDKKTIRKYGISRIDKHGRRIVPSPKDIKEVRWASTDVLMDVLGKRDRETLLELAQNLLETHPEYALGVIKLWLKEMPTKELLGLAKIYLPEYEGCEATRPRPVA